MAGCLKDIGQFIITHCLWPPIKPDFDYWWCFDNNIKELTDGIRDLDRQTFDINQKIEEARLLTYKLRPGVEEWSKAGTEKLGEARRILEDEINRRNLQAEVNRRILQQDDITRRILQQDDITRRILEDDINPKAWNFISRYSMGKRAKKAAKEIAKHLLAGNFNAIADPPPPPAMGFTTDRSIMDFESRKRIEEDIINALKESSVSMIGICGMGGVGKTTMAKRIRERVMEKKLFDEFVMVVVSQQIDMFKIQEEIADWLKLKFDERSMSARAYKLRNRLMDEKKKIIIFDDVWEGKELKLEVLGVPYGFERVKILLTTRSEDLCKNMKVQKSIPIKILTKEEAWFLFKENAGNCVEDSNLFHVAEKIVAECKGLPLALVTVGIALQNKAKSDWENALLQLKRANPTALTEVRINVYNHLKLSYDYLDNDCERFLFLLCCLFPEDYDIPVEELTLYFMGLRIFDDDDITCIKEGRNRIHTLVGNLKSRFLLIDGRKKHHVKMHDVVRDVAIYIGSKVKEPIFIGLKEKNGFLKSLNQISIENSSDINCEWMSLDVSNEPMNVDMGLRRFPKLRLLMLLGLHSDIPLDGIEDLNVLSISNISIGSLPPTVRLLQNLITLYLYRCTVEDISVIGKLSGLEILYCHDCDEIEELPAEIGRLNRLRLLDLNGCSKLQRIPFGILSSLVRLEELKILRSFEGWEAEENGKEKRNASVRELESLTNLTCLEIEISDSNLAAQQICLSPKLIKYKIYIASNYYRYEVRDYEKVMSLELPSEIGAVGKWIQNLVKNTEYLSLEGNGSNNFNIAKCDNLRNLNIRKCSTLKKVVKTRDCNSGIVFPMLETLSLEWLDNLEEIWDGTIILNQNNVSSSLSNLKSVDISDCSKLRYLFSVSVATTCLLQLEELMIDGCSAMEQVFRNDITDQLGSALIEFPNLNKLELTNLPNLEEIWDGTIILNQNNVSSSLSNLRSVRIYKCSKLRYLFSVSVATTCLLQLEELWIENCSAMEQVFRIDITDQLGSALIEFPKLNELRLFKLPKLNALYCLNSETENPKKVVKTRDCNSGIVFPVLERLRLWDLENLEEIWDGTIILNQNNVSSSLSNLKSLHISGCSKLRYLFSVSVATTCLLQLEKLYIYNNSAMEQVFRNDITDQLGSALIEFPNLNILELTNLPNLTSFCQGIENIKFPQLTYMKIGELPKLNSLCPLNSETPHDDTNPFHFLCNTKVEIGDLKTLIVWKSFNNNKFRNIWCDQIPINFFNNLEELKIHCTGGIRSLISYSIAKNLVSLEYLEIYKCEETVEVIEDDDDDKQGVDTKCLFPTLKTLSFREMSKLRRFWQLNHTLELPMLEEVNIYDCPVMETFTMGSLNTPNLKRLEMHGQRIDVMKDLNDTLSHYFMTKNQNTSMIEEEGYNENANRDGNKDENKIEYNDEMRT